MFVSTGSKTYGCQFYKHRLILFAKIGPGEHPCHHCGKLVSWDVSLRDDHTRALVADHLDFDKLNNEPANLVPSCNLCNSTRSDSQRQATVVHNGATVKVADLAARVGLSVQQFKNRLRRMSIDEALSTPSKRVTITHNGESASASEWACRTGLSVTTLLSRLEAGWTPEQALTLPSGSRVRRKAKPKPVRIDSRKRLTFDGRTRTISEWARITGLSYEAINIRLRRGWSTERILTTRASSIVAANRAA